ncbi:hypothetical protein HBB16_16435 [Pseudonocardia sp. MCCB 268]|nr:hypothetical protein [Pseudonocardia cytotoxica]
MTHGLAVAAHRVPPRLARLSSWCAASRCWRDELSRFEPHPTSRTRCPTRVRPAIAGRGHRARETHRRRARNFPEGGLSPDLSTYMTDDELAAKFRHNVAGVLSDAGRRGCGSPRSPTSRTSTTCGGSWSGSAGVAAGLPHRDGHPYIVRHIGGSTS